MLELRPGGSPTFGQGWTPSASEVFDRGRLAYPTSVTPKAGSALLICTAAVNGTIEQFSRSLEQLPLLHAVHERLVGRSDVEVSSRHQMRRSQTPLARLCLTGA